MNDNKINVAFLFGAGAEGTGNYGICNGLEFLRKSLFQKNQKISYAIKDYFNEKIFYNNTYVYKTFEIGLSKRAAINFIYQKAEQNKEFFLKYYSFLKNYYEKPFDEIKSKYNFNDTDIQEIDINKDLILKEITAILKGEKIKYSEIEQDIVKDLFIEGKNDSIESDINIVITDLLDDYFHTIISPIKYGERKFTTVFIYYWKCYFLILSYILKYLNNEKFNACFENEELDYNYILKNLKNITNDLYETQIPTNNTYYDFISKKIKRNNKISCNGVITTNYYRFCETIPATVIYLNGQLKNFEFPETLDVLDLTQDEIPKEKLFFPFIFGQSLIKPIVNSKQTEEFHKLYKLLLDENNNDKSTDVLVILGYNINEDDNHINSFLHEFASKKDKRVIIVTNKESDAHLKLKCDEKKIEYCKVEYLDSSVEHNAADYADKNREIVDKIFNTILNINN